MKKKLFLIATIMIMIFVLTGCGETTIDLNKYITIEANGYESFGAAEYIFDYDSFHNDYSDKIKINSKNSDEIMAQGIEEGKSYDELLLDKCVNGELDQTENLHNGDVITYTWDCREDLAKEYFKCNLKCSDITYTVTELKEPEAFNPFDWLNVSFSGTAPNGTVVFTLDTTQEQMNYVKFIADKFDGLSNGEEIIVTASLFCEEKTFVEKFGITLGETEKTYEVAALPYYVHDTADIPSETLDKMIAQGEDAFRAYVARVWDRPDYLTDVVYAGNYFLTEKPEMNASMHNRLYLVYHITAKNPEPEEMINFYYYILYDNIIITEDGTCNIDIGSYTIPKDEFTFGTYRYVGFENRDSLFNACVGEQMDQYKYASNIQG